VNRGLQQNDWGYRNVNLYQQILTLERRLYAKCGGKPQSATITSDTAFKYGHLVSGWLVVALSYIFWGAEGVMIGAPATIAGIALKEAFIDPVVETVETAGSGFTDWFWWTLGVVAGVITLLLRRIA